ncbi:MAG: ribosome assembly cofactor RimP [Marinirhabdus sp.]
MQQKVEAIVRETLAKKPSLFLVRSEITPSNQITIVIDGDKGVSVQDCIYVSRALEGSLNRDETDFSLEVCSAGATAALQGVRQFKKNVGRTLRIKTQQGENIEGSLIEATDAFAKLQWKTRGPKPVGKGKVTVTKQAEVPYPNIKEAKVMIKFN